jgi:esterase/lipase superfamily enzyme
MTCWFVLLAALSSLLSLVVAVLPLSYAQTTIIQQPTSMTTPLVSTRGHFNPETGELQSSTHSSTDYYASDIPGFNNSALHCPPKDIVIYIHGYWASQLSADEQVHRLNMSLNANNYQVPVVGFSWDSNIGWPVAKLMADQNGPKLAQFIIDFHNKCPNADIRLVAHSLGARVVSSTLLSLNNSRVWNPQPIESVHLMGAAINDKSTSKNELFGNAIAHTVNHFYNLYDPEDNMLKIAFKDLEKQNTLGLLGLNPTQPRPSLNYTEYNVRFEIPPYSNANGTAQPDCLDDRVVGWGDNHCGYTGFRQPKPFDNILRDDGAVNVVVADWRATQKTK